MRDYIYHLVASTSENARDIIADKMTDNFKTEQISNKAIAKENRDNRQYTKVTKRVVTFFGGMGCPEDGLKALLESLVMK